MPKKKKKTRTNTHAAPQTRATPERLLDKYLKDAIVDPEGTVMVPLGGGEHPVILSEGHDGLTKMEIPYEAYDSDAWRDLPGSDMHTLPATTGCGNAVLMCYRDKADEMLLFNGETTIPVSHDDGPIAASLSRSGAVRVSGAAEAVKLPVTSDWTYRITGTRPYPNCEKEGMYIAGLILRDPQSQSGPAYYDGTVVAGKDWFLTVKRLRRLVVCSVQSFGPPIKMWGSVAHPPVGPRA